MKVNLFWTHVIFFVCQISTVCGQEPETGTKKVESFNGLFALQVGIPTGDMQEAIQNNMGNSGIGAGIILLSNPATWGAKNKRNSPLRVGVEAGYTYYGRFISDVSINGYQGDYKTSYGIFQLNALLQVRPRVAEKITPFIELLAGGNFYISTIKENLDVIESSLGIENFDLESYSSAGFNKGVAVGCYIGGHQKAGAAKFAIRGSYNRGGNINYIVRNSVVYDPTNNRLGYEVGEAPADYFMVQVGVGW
ncbi:MAG TPA: hypothetical protein VFD56_11925 [Chitinophagaceae bacterium]|nr:hypothetical protein [Chitinophagaceae bacterium]